jgi:hypothetical protein
MPLVLRNVLLALILSLAIVGTIVYAVNYLDQKRVGELTNIENQLQVDTLSLDTQFSLLESAPCSVAASTTDLTATLDDLGRRLSYTEGRLGTDDPQVRLLRQQYSLLEIRDYLVTKQLAAECGTKRVTVLYFYSNVPGECPACDKAGYTLSYLHDAHPQVRIYSFDYHLELGALQTLTSLMKVKPEFPAFVINGTTSYGFTSLEELETRFPKGALATTTTTAATKK